jgi:hypothetical protein
MVVVRLKGGVGNQLFQYAFGQGVAALNRQPLFYDVSRFKNDPLRSFELQELQLPVASNDILNQFFEKSLVERLKRKVGIPSRFNVIKEQKEYEYLYKLDVHLSNGSNIYFDGYWQNTDYFASKTDISFQLNEVAKRKLCNDALNNGDHNTIALHIRRGDYATNPETRKIHGLLDIQYYEQAIEYFQQRFENIKFYIFSDDINWCKTVFVGKHFSFIMPGERPLHDLLLMSTANHQIIANSTFSWWGAWVNQKPDKTVIAPKQWFADPLQNFKIESLIPKTWVRI